MTPVTKLLGVAGIAALALGACDFGLVLTPDPADPGDTVTVTNAPDGPTCDVPEPGPASAGTAAGVPVGVFLISDFALEEEPEVTVVQTDDDGFFTAEVTAPDIPGEHLVFAVCDWLEGPQETLQAADVVDEDGVIIDELRVAQTPLAIALSDHKVEEGDEVVATFNRCQDENDFDQFAEPEGVGLAADPTPEELANDFPDLQVFLDGTLVETIEGTERYPTGTVEVPLTLEEVGDHEIKGVCTYQTFDLDFESIIELIGEGPELPPLEGVSTAAVDYPFDPEGGLFVWDEATTEAADTVTVTEAAVADTGAEPAEPAPVQPTFTG